MEEKEFLEDGKTPNPKFIKKEDNNGGKTNDDKNGGGKTTFTKEEMQAELDRVASKTRDEERKKTEKLIADEVKKATEEAQRQAKLSEEERQKELLAKEKADLEEQKRNVTIRENLADVKVILGDLKYPPELASLLVDLDQEKQTEKITLLKTAIAKIVKETIADATKGNPLKDVNANNFKGGDGKPRTQF